MMIPSFAVIIAYEKGCRRYLDATAAYAFSTSVRALLRERVDLGWYDDDTDTRRRAEAALATRDSFKCWEFLQSRNEHEYERVECAPLERFSVHST
jgi:hypothetical protein